MKNLNEIESNRLEYRQFSEEDFEDLFEILGDPEVCKYIPGKASYSKEEVKNLLGDFITEFSVEHKNLVYSVFLKGSDIMIGFCGCSYIKEFEKNEIKYFLKPIYFLSGYGLEMAYRMKHVAKELSLHSLVGLADVNNIASGKILRKIGYKHIEDIELWGSFLGYYELTLGK